MAKKAVVKSGASKVTVGIQPLGDRVLVRREDMPDKKSAAGIILPDSSQKEKSKIGMVLAVGPGRVSDHGDLIEMSVEVGQKVIFNAGWDNEVMMNDRNDESEYFLVKESDILAVTK